MATAPAGKTDPDNPQSAGVEPPRPETARPAAAGRLELDKLLTSMEQIIGLEEKLFEAIGALEARVLGGNGGTLTADDLREIEAEAVRLGRRLDILMDSFSRIDSHLKRNGY